MPYHAQPRLDGTYPPVTLYLALSIDAGEVRTLRATTCPSLSTEILSREEYSHLTPAEALDVIAASVDLLGGEL